MFNFEYIYLDTVSYSKKTIIMTPIAVKIHVEFQIWTKICLTDLSTSVDLLDSLVTHHIQVAEIDVLETIRKTLFCENIFIK